MFWLGILLFELLAPLPEKRKTHQIPKLRSEDVTGSQYLHEYEKGVINALIADDELDRPNDVQEVIEVAEMIKDKFEGKNIDV